MSLRDVNVHQSETTEAHTSSSSSSSSFSSSSSSSSFSSSSSSSSGLLIQSQFSVSVLFSVQCERIHVISEYLQCFLKKILKH